MRWLPAWIVPVPDAVDMLDALVPDPQQALPMLALAVAYVVGGAVIAFLRIRRVRRFGGGPLAIGMTLAASAALAASLFPDLVPSDWSLFLLIPSVIILLRPDTVVQNTGGPRAEWRALKAGRELAQLVAMRPSPPLARRNPEIVERLEGLAGIETPVTTAYLDALRAALFVDPAAPATEGLRARLDQEEQVLRARLGVVPWFERAGARTPPPGNPPTGPGAPDPKG